MTTKKTTAPKKVTDVKQESDSNKFAIRQIFYMNQCYDETLIKTLERTYKHQKKTDEEWVEILSNKGITF